MSYQYQVSPVFRRLAEFARGEALSPAHLALLQKCGLVFPDSHGTFRVTPSGKQTLAENPGL